MSEPPEKALRKLRIGQNMPTTRSESRRQKGASSSSQSSRPLAPASASTSKAAATPKSAEERQNYANQVLAMFEPSAPAPNLSYPSSPGDDYLPTVRRDIYSIVRQFVTRVLSEDDELFDQFQNIVTQEILGLDGIRRQAVQDFDDYDSGLLPAEHCAARFHSYMTQIDTQLRDNAMLNNANLAMGVELLMLEGVVARGMDPARSTLYEELIASKMGDVPFAYNIIGETPSEVFDNYASQVERIVVTQSRLAGNMGNWPRLQELLLAKVRAAGSGG